MTAQNISVSFTAESVGVKQSGTADTNRSTDKRSDFESVIGSKSSEVKSDKNIKANADTKSSGKVNVLNNGAASVNKGSAEVNDIEADGLELINVYMEDGKLQVQLIGDFADNDMVVVNIDTVLDELKSLIADILDVSEEDIEEVLEQNGLTMLDILVPQNLQDLFAQVEGMEDFSDILTDDSANRLWMKLSQSVSEFDIQLKPDVHINTEQLADIVRSVMEQNETVVGEEEQTNMLVNPEKEAVVNTEINNSSEINEPQVIINNEATSPVKDEITDTGNNSFSGQGTEYGESESSDALFEEGVIEPGKEFSDVKTGESLFTQFMDKVESAVSNDTPQVVENLHQMREIATQVIEGVRINVRPDTTGFEIQLNPEHLGKVNVSIQMKEGVAVANFTVRDEMARVALENQIQSLKDTFESQGLKVESIEVTVSDFSFRQSDNSWTNENQGREGNGRRFRRDDELDNNGEFAIGSEEASLNMSEEGGINIRA